MTTAVETRVPALRFPEFSGEWEEKKLSKTVLLVSGQHLNPDDYNTSGHGTPYFTGPSDFTNDEKRFSKWSNINGKEAHEGDILITVKGSGLGTMMILKLPKIVIGRQLMAIKENDSNNKFIYQHLLTKEEYFQSLGSGNMIPGIGREDILRTKMFFPTLPEQQKIAQFLTAIDARIELLTRKKTLLEQYKKGVMQQLFSQTIRFKDDNGEEFPEWEEKGGNLLFASVSDRNHNSDLPILAITQEHGAIPRELIDYEVLVSDKSVESYKVVDVGDFIISLRSFQGGIEYSNYKGICSPAYIILRPTVPINNYFFKSYFKTERYISELQKKLEGIRDGKMISYKYFSEIKLPLPSLPEQQKIAAFLGSIDAKINAVDTQLTHTKTYKKGLLQQLFV